MRALTGLFALLIAGSVWAAGPARDDVPVLKGKPGMERLGVAVTPAHFPNHSERDIDEAFQKAKVRGKFAIFIFQWGEIKPQIVKAMIDRSRSMGMVPVIGLSPTKLGGGRKELDMPDAVRQAAGGNLSFANPVVQRAFIDTARGLAEERPPYLCLATEINFLAIGNMKEYLHFANLYKKAYRAVKQVSPETKVFVSFQWELMRAIDAKEPRRLREHGKLVDVFQPALDVFALTTYPAPHHATPADLPADYYTWVYHHVDRSEPVLVMEIGWPTQGAGSEREQRQYVERLPQLFRGMRVELIGWALLHDVQHADFDANLNTVGLFNSDGGAKPAAAAFDALR